MRCKECKGRGWVLMFFSRPLFPKCRACDGTGHAEQLAS